MTGITNHPDELEEQGQARVEAKKDTLPEPGEGWKKDHHSARNQSQPVENSGRSHETGAGRGTELMDQ